MKLRYLFATLVLGTVAAGANAASFHYAGIEGFVTKSDAQGEYFTPEGDSTDADDLLKVYIEEAVLDDQTRGIIASADLSQFWEAFATSTEPNIEALKSEDPNLNADSALPTLTLTGTGTLKGVKGPYRLEIDFIFENKKKAKLTSETDFLVKSIGKFAEIRIVGSDLAFKKYDKDLNDFFDSIKFQ